MAIRKGFSFREDIADWIDKHGKSKYISMLVLADMNSGGCDYVTKGEVIKLIEERVGNSNLINLNDNKIDEDVKNNAIGLFNWK
jgi:hypothetical protein